MKKGKIIFISIGLLVGTIIGFFLNNYFVKYNYEEKYLYINKMKSVENNNYIAIMLKQSDGIYYESDNNVWPNSESYSFDPYLSSCENGGTLDYNDNIITINSNKKDKCYIYFNTGTTAYNFANNYSNYNNVIDKNGYRYSGAYNIVNNYICFGSSEETCPENNLYRIIGAFNLDGYYKYKLIRADYGSEEIGQQDNYARGGGNTKQSYFSTYMWDSNSSTVEARNIWERSDIQPKLNTIFLNTFTEYWLNQINDSTWYVYGNTSVRTSDNMYSSESTATSWIGKVGLMYTSDYGYAVPSYGNSLYNYSNTGISDYNWLYNTTSTCEWTITRCSNNGQNIFSISYDGAVTERQSNVPCAVRPVFYLKPNVGIITGTGTSTNPYRII